MSVPPPEDDQPETMQVMVLPAQQGGVWANLAGVFHTDHEFTIDFIRTDPLVPNRGILVARVSMSPLMITQLMDTVQENWDAFAAKALPKEVYDDGEPPAEDVGPGAS